jgi:hypothetical protein
MALSLPSDDVIDLVSRYQAEVINGRSIKRNTRRCSGVEIWRRMHLHDSDLYYRVLGAGLRALLNRCEYGSMILIDPVVTN